MSQSSKSTMPRARSIVVLGLSRQARRFLARINIKTVDALSKTDADYLLCNGASGEIVAELAPYIAAQSTSIDEPCAIDATLFDANLSTRATAYAIDAENVPPANEGELAGQEAAGDDSALLPRYKHVSILEALQLVESGASENLPDADKFIALGKFLAEPENNQLAIHSADKAALRVIANEAFKQHAKAMEETGSIYALLPIPVTELSLSTRPLNIMRVNGIRTIGDLCNLGETGFLDLRNAGKGSVEEVVDALEKLDQRLPQLFRSTLRPKDDDADEYEETPAAQVSSLLKETPLITADLSTRSAKALRREGLISIGSILEIGQSGVLGIRNLGILSAEEIWEAAITQAKKVDPLFFERRKEADSSENHSTSTHRDSAEGTKYLLRDIANMAAISPITCQAYYEKKIRKETIVREINGSLLLQIFDDNVWGITREECLEQAHFYDESCQTESIDESLELLFEMGRIIEHDGLLMLKEPSLQEAVNRRLEDSDKGRILLQRFSGKTLREVADQFDLTRERIRQITNQTLRQGLIDDTRAARYSQLINKYDLNDREGIDALGATPEEWEAANLLAKVNQKPEATLLPAEKFVEDKAVPLRIRLALDREIHHGFVRIDGEYIPEKRLDLLLYALKRHGSKNSISDEELLGFYSSMLNDLGLQENPDLKIHERYFQNFRLQQCVLSDYKHRVRFYDFDYETVDELINQLNFSQFQNKEISTKVFLQLYPDLLRSYEIDNAYELHSLMRTFQNEAEKRNRSVPYALGRRMPMVNIGSTDRERQVFELARELSPVSPDDLAEAYEENYGVEVNTFMANYFSFVANYLTCGIIDMSLPSFLPEERQRMAALLLNDFYPLSEVESMFTREFPDAEIERLNAASLRDLGFKVYSTCILKNTWGSQSEYFDFLTLSEFFFQESTLSQSILENHAFQVQLDANVRSRKLLPYEAGEWVTERGLEELGISNNDLVDFADQAEAFCEANQISYCTAPSLEDSGFTHSLFDYELDDQFYAAALCANNTRFSTLLCGGKRIACFDGATASIAAFIDNQIPEQSSMDVYDLIDYVQDHYHITVKRDKVVAAPGRTELYYSSIMERIYKDRQTFLREVD